MAFIWIGSLISVLGWLFLILGVGLESGSSVLTRSLVDVHRVTIASNVIYLGYFLILIGLALNLQKRLTVAKPLSEPEAKFSVEERATDDNRSLERAFQREFNKTVNVRADGSVRVFTGVGAFLDFRDADEAWEYCIDHFYNPPAQPQ